LLFALTDTSPRVLVWANVEQTALVQRICELAGLTVVMAGSPRKGQTGHLAARWGCKSCDDLRHALAQGGIDGVVLMTLEGFLDSDHFESDADVAREAGAKGIKLVTLEPAIPALSDLCRLEGLGASALGGVMKSMGLPRRGKRFGLLTDMIPDFGRISTMSIESHGPAVEGTLGARLVGALDASLAFMGEPVALASFASSGTSGLSADSIRSVNGELTVSGRTGDGAVLVIRVSNTRARHWFRVACSGEGGEIIFEPSGLEWMGSDGAVREFTDFGTQSIVAGSRLLADDLARALYPGGQEGAPVAWESILATAQAALLAAKTGQVESPETIRRMSRLVR